MKRKIGKALVAGGGISGIRAALDLAEFGYGVTLIDRSAHLGGVLSQLDYQFPTDRCGMCKMLPLIDRDASSQYCLRKGLFHENIDIMLSTELQSVEGEPGHYQVRLRTKPSPVDPAACIGCGLCADVCPVEVPDEFNAGLSMRKAIYLPVPHAIPNPYVIDPAACTRCKACEPVCPTGAIRLSQQDRSRFRILVVDDELIVRDSLKEWLEIEEGFSVDMAESGQEALDKLGENDYRLMLLDIKMPGMDGVEVLEKAKDRFPDICVVMMTAYATVETAVEAMKIGALDYLIKPFDPDVLIPKIIQIHDDFEAARGPELEVGAIVLAAGSTYFNPADGRDTFAYGASPDVVTSLEFERIFSGTGPCRGKLVKPSDGKPIRKIAWIQCVGSRDLQLDADFCSNICCMFSIKEALVAREKAEADGLDLETTIYYMDMRTFGKSFQRYRDQAEERGVRFERARIHSVVADDAGKLNLRFEDYTGELRDAVPDLVVLATGQRPTPDAAAMAEMLDIELNPWGFPRTEPFSLTRTGRQGIILGGAFSGLKDISEAVTASSAAALSASRVIHAAGGGLEPRDAPADEFRDVSRETPKTLAVFCACGETLSNIADIDAISLDLERDPAVCRTAVIKQVCTAGGWDELKELASSVKPNRLLIGACLPYVYARKLKALGREIGLDPALMEVVDIRTPALQIQDPDSDAEKKRVTADISSVMQAGLARLKYASPDASDLVPVFQQALVIGGGIAGMTAALAIADHGYAVDLVEKGEALGGNLSWLKRTLEGHETQALLDETRALAEKHPRITIHLNAAIVGGYGEAGRFHTSIETADAGIKNLLHGAVILATGGSEAGVTAYGRGEIPGVVTQKTVEQELSENAFDMDGVDCAVFIQCVESREEPRNYCSRVCCMTTLKHALAFKEKKPDMSVFVLYRDMMSYGFSETYFTEARRKGIIFIPYSTDRKPEVSAGSDGKALVKTFEPILGRDVEIAADRVILAAGLVPNLPTELTETFGVSLDRDGFFQEAESKWRPTDALKEGVFACGVCHSPRSIPESVATAEAAAQRALRLLSRERIPAGRVVAHVRRSLCSLCERCIDACPYGARMYDEAAGRIVVNALMCQGCGSCAAVCPNSASYVEGYAFDQMLAVIDAACA